MSIVTGQIDDEGETIKAVEAASAFPLSILVGVGDGPFKLMHEMDDGLVRHFDNLQFLSAEEVGVGQAYALRASSDAAAKKRAAAEDENFALQVIDNELDISRSRRPSL